MYIVTCPIMRPVDYFFLLAPIFVHWLWLFFGSWILGGILVYIIYGWMNNLKCFFFVCIRICSRKLLSKEKTWGGSIHSICQYLKWSDESILFFQDTTLLKHKLKSYFSIVDMHTILTSPFTRHLKKNLCAFNLKLWKSL